MPRKESQQVATLLPTSIMFLFFSSLFFYWTILQRHKTSPKIVAQRTGAARFEEYFDDENASHESKLKKRYSQDPDIETGDNDPEIYQGVLGRPGVDFPVMTTIPKTKFECRNLGNGYFADLETSCQVTLVSYKPTSIDSLFRCLLGLPHLRRRP